MSKLEPRKELPKKYIYILAAVIVALLVYFVFPMKPQTNKLKMEVNNKNSEQNYQVNRQNCLSDECLIVEDLNYPVSALPETVKNALDEAISDEYKALSTYNQVINKFGQVRPFSMIKGAEEQHIASLKAIYDKYGLEVPENTWLNKTANPTSLKQACQIGVDAEIANADLYKNKLLPAVIDYADITLVFTKLMNASQLKHLPAFNKCN